ncbi:MAG: hypothetical protein KAI76_10870 [Alphaproteobacteria bacterium]|nr:hypothetical protein [Alphaproteobacteria bacterium]
MRFFLTLIAALILVAHPVDASSVKSHSNSTAVMSSPSVQNVEPGTAKAQDVESVARKANQKKYEYAVFFHRPGAMQARVS